MQENLKETSELFWTPVKINWRKDSGVIVTILSMCL